MVLLTILPLLFLAAPTAFGQKDSDPQFKVKIDFNRWHDIPELFADMKRMEKAWPKFLKLESVGKSHNGYDMMVMTINNPATGPELSKSAMWIDANNHGNEIQGCEVCLYTIWYLMENYGKIEQITKLVDERVFYIMPSVNPDGHQCFMEGEGGNSRTGQVPRDDDNDGEYDEDGPNDLNGNGVIESIRKYVPGAGTHRMIPGSDPEQLEAVGFGEVGDYIMLGREGKDDDGDGSVNEDGPGSYDPNRNWGSQWQPSYIQGGSMDYPFQLPETRAVSEFMLAHPNIAGVQAYHNSGGMILRPPGAEEFGEYPASDLRAYDEMGRNGERMLPYYDYIILWKDLYTTYGGSIDWTNDSLGIISYCNELWNGGQYYNSPKLVEQQADPNSPISRGKSNNFFDKYLEFGSTYTEWKEFDHPDYGKVEIGGSFDKFRGRIPPRFMNEELCHRNMAFTLYQADELPMMAFGETSVKKIGDGVYKVWIDLTNSKVTPTITAIGARNKVVRPDLLTLKGDAEVISASWIGDKLVEVHNPSITSMIEQHDLKRMMLRQGHPGKTTKTLQYLVKGSGAITFTYDSVKGGVVSTNVTLR